MSNLKPFSLERWRAGDKIQYRDGRTVLDMHYFDFPEFHINNPITAIAWDGSFTAHLSDGSFTHYAKEHPRDIVMSPKKTMHYFASWETSTKGDVTRITTNMYKSKEDLLKTAIVISHEKYTIHEIEIEE